jgi:hypothetical protein
MGTTDHRDIMLVAGEDPYTFKGTADLMRSTSDSTEKAATSADHLPNLRCSASWVLALIRRVRIATVASWVVRHARLVRALPWVLPSTIVEVEGARVDAIALSRRAGPIVEHVAEVGAAAAAQYFGPAHEQTVIGP